MSTWRAAYHYAELAFNHYNRPILGDLPSVEPEDRAEQLVILTHAITAAAMSAGIMPRDPQALVSGPEALADVPLLEVQHEHLNPMRAAKVFITGQEGAAPQPDDPGWTDDARLRAQMSLGGATARDVRKNTALGSALGDAGEKWRRLLAEVGSMVNATVLYHLTNYMVHETAEINVPLSALTTLVDATENEMA